MVFAALQGRTALCFAPHFLAASKPTPNGHLSAKQKKAFARSSKLKLKNPVDFSPTTSNGGDATSYTCLPPKDDFYTPLLQSSIREVKLSESSPIQAPKSAKNARKRYDFAAENPEDNVKFELYEVGSESEYENDDDFDESRDGVDEIMRFLGSSTREYHLSTSSLIKAPESERNAGKRFNFVAEISEDNGKFELYEVGSDSDYESDDDFDESHDGIDEIVDFGSTRNGEGDEEFGENDVVESEGVREKEKGVPAVMRCFDRTKIYVKAGDGGNGVVAFRREKFVPLGGPSGGDGGRGGNVYVEVDESMNSLLPFRKSVHFRGGRGGHGHGREKHGAKGVDVVVNVPPGTVIRESAGEDGTTGDVLLELLNPGQRVLLLPGGRGGRGNASFKSGTNKAPKIAENGEEGMEMWLELELKLVADVGIVGVPNAGKSTFLSVISAAKPAIANYPFTTLLPNLGVVSLDYDATMVVADLPGLLEGAHRGFGLGHEFLRHAERCSIMVHVVDGSCPQPEYEFDAVRLELEMFSPELAEKDFLVAFNKMDLPEARENWISFKEKLSAHGIEVFSMSAVKGEGTHEVICAAYRHVQKLKEARKEGATSPVNLNYVADMMQKQRSAPISEFEISHDKTTNTWHVVGSGLQRFVQMTNWRYVDSERRFQHVLEACGVNKTLLNLGVKDGDTVVVGEMEMVWYDASDVAGPISKRKWAEDHFR